MGTGCEGGQEVGRSIPFNTETQTIDRVTQRFSYHCLLNIYNFFTDDHSLDYTDRHPLVIYTVVWTNFKFYNFFEKILIFIHFRFYWWKKISSCKNNGAHLSILTLRFCGVLYHFIWCTLLLSNLFLVDSLQLIQNNFFFISMTINIFIVFIFIFYFYIFFASSLCHLRRPLSKSQWYDHWVSPSISS